MNEPGKISVFDAANFFLSKVKVEAGGFMSYFRLQTLCYYAQAWYYTIYGRSLFPEKIIAKINGPICQELWDKYRELPFDRTVPIPKIIDLRKLDNEPLLILEEVWDKYGGFDGQVLQQMVTSEPPWTRTRMAFQRRFSKNTVISLDSMKRYYSKLSNQDKNYNNVQLN